MFCSNCGAEVTPGQRYCEKCGSPVTQGTVNMVVPQPVVAPKKKSSLPIIIIACLGGIAVLGTSAFVGYKIAKSIKVTRYSAEFVDEINPEDYLGEIESDYSQDGDELADNFFDDEFEKWKDNEKETDEETDEDIEEVTPSYEEIFGDFSFEQYSYAAATTFENYMMLSGLDAIKDDTVIYGDKTIGGFCDYIDSEVLDKGNKINRELLYSLMAVHLVDESFYEGNGNTEYFEQSMMYCLLFTNEFADQKMTLQSCMYYLDAPTTYYYTFDMGDEIDTWTVDYNKEQIAMNFGMTQYKSAGEFSMFSEKSKTGWLYVIDKYFEID